MKHQTTIVTACVALALSTMASAQTVVMYNDFSAPFGANVSTITLDTGGGTPGPVSGSLIDYATGTATPYTLTISQTQIGTYLANQYSAQGPTVELTGDARDLYPGIEDGEADLCMGQLETAAAETYTITVTGLPANAMPV